MTEIEKQALVDEFADCEQVTFEHSPPYSLRKALCRALEQKAALQAEFDQFRQDVSDAVEAWRDADVMSEVSAAAAKLHSFILPSLPIRWLRLSMKHSHMRTWSS